MRIAVSSPKIETLAGLQKPKSTKSAFSRKIALFKIIDYAGKQLNYFSNLLLSSGKTKIGWYFLASSIGNDPYDMIIKISPS